LSRVKHIFRSKGPFKSCRAGVDDAELNLNGSYLVQLELSRQEIARLFYLTHADAELPELIKFFSELKHEEKVGAPRLDTA
jgi:hypothetical protein